MVIYVVCRAVLTLVSVHLLVLLIVLSFVGVGDLRVSMLLMLVVSECFVGGGSGALDFVSCT